MDTEILAQARAALPPGRAPLRDSALISALTAEVRRQDNTLFELQVAAEALVLAIRASASNVEIRALADALLNVRPHWSESYGVERRAHV